MGAIVFLLGQQSEQSARVDTGTEFETYFNGVWFGVGEGSQRTKGCVTPGVDVCDILGGFADHDISRFGMQISANSIDNKVLDASVEAGSREVKLLLVAGNYTTNKHSLPGNTRMGNILQNCSREIINLNANFVILFSEVDCVPFSIIQSALLVLQLLEGVFALHIEGEEAVLHVKEEIKGVFLVIGPNPNDSIRCFGAE